MTDQGADRYGEIIAETWSEHLAPIVAHILHRVSTSHLNPNLKDPPRIPALDRLAIPLDALLPAFCDPGNRGPVPTSLKVRVIAAAMLRAILSASIDRLTDPAWDAVHPRLAHMRRTPNDRSSIKTVHPLQSVSTTCGGHVTAWGTNAPDAHAVLVGIVPRPSFEDALALATSLLPRRV